MAWDVGSVGVGILGRSLVRGGATVLVGRPSGTDGVRVAVAVALALVAEVLRDHHVGVGRSHHLMHRIAARHQYDLP